MMDDGTATSGAPSRDEVPDLQRKLREQAALIAHPRAEGSVGQKAPAIPLVPAAAMTAAALKLQKSEAVHPDPETADAPGQGLAAFGVDSIPMIEVPPAPDPGFGESAAGLPPGARPAPPVGFAEARAGLPHGDPNGQRPTHQPPQPPARVSMPGFVPPLAPMSAPTPKPEPAPPVALPPMEGEPSREVAPSDVMPMVADGGAAARGNRRKHGVILRTIAAVFLVQALLGTGLLAAMYYFPPFRATVRKLSHRVLGTSAIVAQAEPRWIPLDPAMSTSAITSPDPVNFEKIGNLEENVEDIQRFLGVTSKEALNEISRMKERNQLTRLADEAITRGSRSAYMQIASTAETSRDSAQVNSAEAELLRVKFFFASGTRSASYSLPMATLYPEGKSKKEEQLTQKELVALLLNSEMDWRVRRRVAFLLGDKRSYEAAESLAEAIRSDPSLDVIKESVYSFEALTGYRSPDLFEMKHLLEWWDTNAVEVKKKLG